MKTGKTLLLNPVSLVHARNVEIFEKFLPEFNLRCIYNPRQPWFSDRKKINESEAVYFGSGHFQYVPQSAFDGVEAVILFTAQSRVPSCSIIQEAALRSIPVIAIEEVHMMMLEQEYVNNYVLPVDHLFVASEYERKHFIQAGVSESVAKTMGSIFRYKQLNKLADSEKKELKKKMGLTCDKHIATLGLAFYNPQGETPEVRKNLLECVSGGLPDNYELLIKPHPSERDKNFNEFIKKYAPNAKIAPPSTPIDEILDVTDVLFNRGNSQIIIDALQRDIPVVAIPVGRKTFFDEVLRELIVNEKSDVKKALNVLNQGGMAVYKEVFKRHLSIPPEKALENVMSAIRRIVEKKERSNDKDNLVKLSLFWAWMGYRSQAAKTLELARTGSLDTVLLEAVYKLVSLEADKRELTIIRKWCGVVGYIEYLVKSLWIKALHMKGKDMDKSDREWMSDFPPRTNAPAFIPYAIFLYWSYRKSGMHSEADNLVERIASEHPFINRIDRDYLRARFNYTVVPAVKDMLWRFETIFK